MSIIADKISSRASTRAFTLIELMTAIVVSSIVFIGLFSAVIFLARNLTRLSGFERQQAQNRVALVNFAKDVGDATAYILTTTQPITLTLVTSSGVVTYVYDSAGRTLKRQLGSGTPQTLLTSLNSLSFDCYDRTGANSTLPSTTKQIQLSYVSAVGKASSGTQSTNAISSARIVLRSKVTSGN